MKPTMTDTFGPMLFRSITELQKKLEEASRISARFIQSSWTKGIRSQSLANNSVKKWDPLSEGYKNSSRKKKGSSLTNILTGQYSGSINVEKNNMGYYEVGSNANHKGHYYPLTLEFGSKKYPQMERPSLRPVLILSRETVFENFKEAVKESFQK
ncbi:MAG: hypothetical protein KBF93_21455 [Leptospiraceae bacterium]|nr:hypothetical protein [Leptospiraceae bacterium]